MGLREKLMERSRPFLEPMEEPRFVFLGQSAIPWFVNSLLVKFRMVVVTDQRIVVLAMPLGAWGIYKPKSVVRTLPRATMIGPVQGLWAKTTTLGERLYINKRFHNDVKAADLGASAS